jgi:hypothetical protein
MSETGAPGEELDRDTTTGNDLANWLNAHGPEWVIEIKRTGGGTEYVGFVDGRFRNFVDDEVNNVALGYLANAADAARRINAIRYEESPFAEDEDEDDD